MHSWFTDLATAHAAGAAALGQLAPQHPPLRFVSLQSDSPRAKALCRRLGVSASLSAAIIDPSSGRKLMELCGRRMQAELPAGVRVFFVWGCAGLHREVGWGWQPQSDHD
jgi:hypothetical protein